MRAALSHRSRLYIYSFVPQYMPGNKHYDACIYIDMRSATNNYIDLETLIPMMLYWKTTEQAS